MADETGDNVRIQISFSVNSEEVGTIKEVSRFEAAAMVSEGRARYVDAEGKPMPPRTRRDRREPQPEPRPSLTNPAPAEGNPTTNPANGPTGSPGNGPPPPTTRATPQAK